MSIDITVSDNTSPIERGYAISMTIRSFKGRRDVDVHLFRKSWDAAEEEAIDWTMALEAGTPNDTSKNVVMETFTQAERDEVLRWLGEQYATRLTAIQSAPVALPLPPNLTPLSAIEADKTVGFIEFEKIPSYPLQIPMRGIYDLNLHKPLVEG